MSPHSRIEVTGKPLNSYLVIDSGSSKHTSCKFCERASFLVSRPSLARRGSSMLMWPMERQRGIPPLSVVWNRLWNGMRNSARCEKTVVLWPVWQLRASCSSPHPPSNLILSLYAKHTFSKDTLVGTCGIPLEPQRGVFCSLTVAHSTSWFPACRRCCRPYQGRRQSKSTSHPRFDYFVSGRFIFLNDQSRQSLHPDTDRRKQSTSQRSYCATRSSTHYGVVPNNCCLYLEPSFTLNG